MKTTLATFSAVVAISALSLPAAIAEEITNRTDRTGSFQNGTDRTDSFNRNNPAWNRSSRTQLGTVSKSSKVIGAEVRNAADEKLGKVEDLAIDLEAGRIVQVILSVGGVLGIGDKLVAVPPSSFSVDSDNKVRLETDKARLKASEKFDTSRWEDNFQPSQVSRVYREYNTEPYFSDSSASRGVTGASRAGIGYTEKASKLVGLSIKNNQDESVGKVNDLTLDLTAGRVVNVVVSAGGFLGVGDELNFVPPSSFRYNGEHNGLLLDVSKESLTSAPRFKNTEWPDLSNRDSVSEVYRYYRVEPYFSGDADNSGRNVVDRNNSTLTPLDQGNGEADLAMTRNIRTGIQQMEGLSVNARNIKVITRDGKVTLRGAVDSGAERAALSELARRYVTSGNIDNQLEVKQGSVNR
jgi:hyperosmotically inducible protein